MIQKTIYNEHLMNPDSITVECGGESRTFDVNDKAQVEEWIQSIWRKEFFPSPANVFYNIGWDADHVLYCRYELKEVAG